MEKVLVRCTKCLNLGNNNRIRRPEALKIFLPFLPIKKYQCFHCLKTFYKIKLFSRFYTVRGNERISYFKDHTNNYNKGILVLVSLLVCLLYGSYYNIRRASTEKQWVKHPEEVMLHAAKIRLMLIETEIQTTDYMLTGTPLYIGKYLSAKNEVLNELETVKKLVVSNPVSLNYLHTATSNINSALKFSDQMIKIRQTKGLNEAISFKQKNLSDKYTDRANTYLLHLEKNESTLLTKRTLAYNNAVFIMNVSIFITCILFLILLIVIIKRARKIAVECSHLVDELSYAAVNLEDLNKQLIVQNKALEQFSHMVSHDLRAPVANIIGLGHILETMEEESDDRKTVLTHIVASAYKFDYMFRNLTQILQPAKQIPEQKFL